MRPVLPILASIVLALSALPALAERPEHPAHPMPPPGKAIGWHARNDVTTPPSGGGSGSVSSGSGSGSSTAPPGVPTPPAEPDPGPDPDPAPPAEPEPVEPDDEPAPPEDAGPAGTAVPAGPRAPGPWVRAGGSADPFDPAPAGTPVPAADGPGPVAAPPVAPAAPPASSAVVATVALGAAAASAGALTGWRTGALRRGWLWLLLPLYSRLRRAEVLASEARRRLLDAIGERPGVHASELRRVLSIENGVLLHHLAVLEKNGYVRSDVDERVRRFWVAGAAPPAPARPAVSAQVFDFVAHHPAATSAQVADALHKRPTLVHYHVLRLARAGQLRRERVGREVRLYASG